MSVEGHQDDAHFFLSITTKSEFHFLSKNDFTSLQKLRSLSSKAFSKPFFLRYLLKQFLRMTLFWLSYYILLSVGLYLVFPKTGEEGWKGLIPGLNFVVWSKLIGRKPWWPALLLIPIVNIFIYAGMAVNMARSFGKFSFLHSFLAVIFTPLYFIWLGISKKESYNGPVILEEAAYKKKIEEAKEKNQSRQLKKLLSNNPYKKSPAREWVDAIIFAVFAAAFIRMFLIEAYMIPTSSMEGSLMVGDFLFVSKASYGIRTPQTIAMVPLLHNRIPFLNTESYLKSPQLNYSRLPAIRNINHNSPVVFNFPAGDSVYVFPHRTWTAQDVKYDALPPSDKKVVELGRKDLVIRPMDKRDHYIKRCVGLPGDSLQIVNRQLVINGKTTENPSNLQFIYHLRAPNGINQKEFTKWGISDEDRLRIDKSSKSMLVILNEKQAQKIRQMDGANEVGPTMEYIVNTPANYGFQLFAKYGIDETNFRGQFANNSFFLSLTDKQAQAVQSDTIFTIKNYETNPIRLFPHAPKYYPNWTVDNFGPIYIPKAGATVKLDRKSIKFYERVINVYEGNDFEIKNGKYFINGEEATEYTFKMNYYWMMGDNRHNSEDSRVWGFVPEDHVVGRPLFIWMALREGTTSKGINLSRLGLVGRHLK